MISIKVVHFGGKRHTTGITVLFAVQIQTSFYGINTAKTLVLNYTGLNQYRTNLYTGVTLLGGNFLGVILTLFGVIKRLLGHTARVLLNTHVFSNKHLGSVKI